MFRVLKFLLLLVHLNFQSCLDFYPAQFNFLSQSSYLFDYLDFEWLLGCLLTSFNICREYRCMCVFFKMLVQLKDKFFTNDVLKVVISFF